MDDPKRKRIKSLAYLIPLAVIIGIAAFILRGPHISNALKKLILPELEQMVGRKVIAQKIYVNLFPLFVEAKGLKVFDDKGERILMVQRAKAYVDLTGIVGKEIKIRRLVLKEPEIATDRKQAAEIADNVKAYLERVRDTAFKVKIKAVEVQKGGVHYRDEVYGADSLIDGLDGEMIVGEWQRVNVSLRKFDVKKEGWPDISGNADVALSVKDGNVQIKRLVIGSLGSTIAGTGEYAGGKASVKTKIDLFMKTVKKLFGLKSSGEGEVRAGGLVKYMDKGITLDLKVDGKFYLQTLMELLKAKERIEGLIDVKATLTGPLRHIRGSGTAVLTDGNLFDVDVKRLKCAVSYADGLMRFTDGAGSLYNGSAKVSASITLPVVNAFTVDVAFNDVDSHPLFRLIGWDPGVPAGKVNGTLLTSGAAFNPEGKFEYRSVEKGKDVFGRVRDISGAYRMAGQMVTLTGLKVATGLSEIQAGGTVDIGKKSLDIDCRLKSSDITDLTAPYYYRLKGAGGFGGRIAGAFDDPIVSGQIDIENPVFEKYAAEAINAGLIYRREALTIREMTVRGKGQSAVLSGGIAFKGAKALFDLSRPEYKLTASLRNTDLEGFAKIFYPDFKGSGRLHSDITIGGTGDMPDISGSASADHATVFNVPFDTADFRWAYRDEKLTFMKMRVTRGRSVLTGDASIDSGGNFFYSAYSDKVLLSDIVRREIKGDAIFSVKSEGHGTVKDPSITLDARMVEGRLKGKPVGSGTISASIKGKDISVRARMINDKVLLTARGRFEKEMPWEAKIEIQKGRYDFIISAFLKDVPEDLIVSMNGQAILRGDKEHINGSLTLDQLALSMYGYSFTSEKQIRLDLNDRRLSLEKVTMRSGNMSLGLDGNVELGKKYNLSMEGSSSLSPLKGLSSKIGLLKGDAEFVLGVTGDWDNPEINGGVTLQNGSFGLKDYSYRISALSGYLYMDNDRIVLQKLSGRLGGGDIDISGILYLKKFSLRRFYVEAGLRNITVSPSNEFNINFGGNLLYKGTPDSQIVSGDLQINRARYRERVEWKSWLLKTKTAAKYKSEISGLEKAGLNIRITGKDNIFIDNNVARASVSADMVLRGSVYRPLLFGRVETTDGTVYFRNNEFRILHASVGFFDPNRINPVIEIASETSVKGYRIKMNLEGQIDHFNMSLSSDPVLKEMDILSLLTVGQTGGELKGLEGGIGAGEATSFVTGKLQDVVEERLRTITGLDRMQIDPHVSKKTGTVEPGVTFSKRLLGDKVFVTYTTAVHSSDEQIIKLEYFLTKKISLVGLRDERGIVGGDIHFRFEFK
jgi:autotransporter translocation and assembly factor TamB